MGGGARPVRRDGFLVVDRPVVGRADVTEANGCLRFIPDEGRPRALLPHGPGRGGADSHALVATGFDDSAAVTCPLAPGMVTLHRVTTLHSSGPNTTDEPRLGRALQFRDPGRWSWLPAPIRSRLGNAKRALVR